MKVSIIIPTIRREKLKRCLDVIDQNAGIPKEDYEVLFLEDTKRIGCPKMVKKLVARTKYDNVCYLGDDTIPQPDFLKNALAAMAALPDGWGMVSFNDNPTQSVNFAHWLCSKKLLPELDGEFFHTGYTHCFCDNELVVRCQTLNRFIYAYDAVLEHDHFIFKGGKPDSKDMKRVYAEDVFDKDQQLFNARSMNGWKTPTSSPKGPTKVVVGVPSGDTLHSGFAMCLVALTSYAVQTGIHIAALNQNSSIIEVGRNTIVEKAIELKADYLLTLDSDMTFPSDLLHRLLVHGRDIVCCDASTRRPPFKTVCTGMDGKLLRGRGLVEVKGGTSAVQLVKVSALKKLEPPHYAVTWDEDNGSHFVGEDYYFTRKMAAAGFKTYCDLDLSKEIGHIGLKEFKIEDIHD